MKIRIYQIDRDKDNGSLSFLNYKILLNGPAEEYEVKSTTRYLTAMLSAAGLKMFILCSTKTIPSHSPVTLFRCRIS